MLSFEPGSRAFNTHGVGARKYLESALDLETDVALLLNLVKVHTVPPFIAITEFVNAGSVN